MTIKEKHLAIIAEVERNHTDNFGRMPLRVHEQVLGARRAIACCRVLLEDIHGPDPFYARVRQQLIIATRKRREHAEQFWWDAVGAEALAGQEAALRDVFEAAFALAWPPGSAEA